MATDWTPRFSFDLHSGSAGAFAKMLEDFEMWRAVEPVRLLDTTNGWKTITPQYAEGALLRNPVGANRRPTLQTVKYYARQMSGEGGHGWKKTGQAILFDTEGKLLDAGHRLWAGYLSRSTFPSYVIGDVPADPTLFAYIDNCKPRSVADALATAGLNGLSKQIGAVASISMHFEHGCYTASKKSPLGKVPPVEVIDYIRENDNLRQAVRLMAGEYKSAAKVMIYKDVAAFVAYQIIELHGEEVLDDFMVEMGQVTDDPEEGSPIAALHKVFMQDGKAKEPLQKHQLLGHIIKGFNSWIARDQVKKITLNVNETFPRFAIPRPVQQAAE